jgi:uncharacterized protein
MAQSAGLHEPAESLPVEAIDRHRVIVSIQEELEAVDWYDQRVCATTDESVAAVLAHNRDEEKEHASMAIEWLRRHDSVFDRHLRTYLFTSDPITEIEVEAEHEAGTAESAAAPAGDSLGIGSLKGAAT